MTSLATRRKQAQDFLLGLREEIREYARQVRLAHAHRGLWADAESYRELCALMERFVLGELVNWPYHLGPRNDETVEIERALAHANSVGFLTTGSQPGSDTLMINYDGTPAECGARWEQRAAGEGFCSPELATRIASVVIGHSRLRMQINVPRQGQRKIDYSTAVVVSKVHDDPQTEFGATLNKREIERMWEGIQDHLLDEIIPMCQVLIYDPEWGPGTQLWERLEVL